MATCMYGTSVLAGRTQQRGACLTGARQISISGGMPLKSALHMQRPVSRSRCVQARADNGRGGGDFFTGFVVGGVIFGALGFLFAPQISAALLSDDQRLKLPKFLEEEKDPEATKQDLADKIAQLNSAIDDVSAQLKAQDVALTEEPAVA